ncbi:hypothetical protein FEE95_19970 [Maribacter algarum]|uniref:Uncharacterized protein n=1 Tax=Maribacter algarum (ex Zhang et al. 2020) TaxID=2578118 RepID=A0A5S3PGU2_9FLAO|nr:hypothetical protein [Maribacter algarum]TMM53342.1 hypothetical protein FEE95_19970 [Maribacter algarum]
MKSIPYFSAKEIKISSNDFALENRILKEFGLKSSDETLLDLVYLDNPEENVLTVYTDKIHNDSFFFLKNIHSTKKTTEIWEALRNNKKVTVSIDMFYCGLLFIRKEQAKEHFKIRI